jgi:hypothetical protein
MKVRVHQRSVVVGGVVVLALVVAFAVLTWDGSDGPEGNNAEELAGEVGRAGEPEVEEELEEQTEQRLDALEEADARGVRWRVTSVDATPAPGWVADRHADDWEPAMAADPNAPYVYLLTTHFVDKPCPGNCPVPHLSLHVSPDGGKTWAAQRPLCACKGSWQYDPQIEVVPDTGAVYAAYLNGFNVVFVKSTDHGTSWSAPVPTWGNVSWGDKPALATSDDGRDVYISWNGPTGGDPWVAQSHDFGQVRLNWLPYQHLVASPTTSPSQPRVGRFRASRIRLACSRRSHGNDRDCPTSKYSATISPPNGATNRSASPRCHDSEVPSWPTLSAPPTPTA